MRASRLYVVVLLILILPGLTLARQSPQRDATAALNQALQLAREHRYAEAAAALKGVSPPSNPAQQIAFYRLKGAIASGLNQFSVAAENMDLAAKLAPEDQGLRVAAELARLQEQIESHRDATETLKRLRSTPLPPQQALDLRLRLAEILSTANHFSEATSDFAAAAALAPGRPDLLYDLALANFRSGRLDDALANAETARSLEDNGSIESLLGDIHEKRGDALAAVHCYQAAITLEPAEERHRLALALELLRHQTFNAALVVLNQSASLFPKSIRIKILVGLAYYFVDRSADAVQALLEAAELDAQDETAARYLGEITLEDTATPNAQATNHICKFADEHPRDKTAGAFCGGILLRVARDSGDISRRAYIIRRLQHAARVAPTEPTARCQLGKAYEWAEQWNEAKTEMESCVRLDPNSPDSHYQLSRVYRRLGLPALASQQLALQEVAAARQSVDSTRRTESVSKFLVLLEH
jgi:tetratricopeptide (TPR) repeat protein